MKQFLILLFFASLGTTNVLERTIQTTISINFDINTTSEHNLETNFSLSTIPIFNSTSIITDDEANKPVEQEPVYDNNYADQLPQISNVTPAEFNYGPQYEAYWTFIDKEAVRAVFTLFSLTKSTEEKNIIEKHDSALNIFPTILATPSCSIKSIYSLKFFLFVIRQYKTNSEEVLPLTSLNLKSAPLRNYAFFNNSLSLVRLNPKEKYSVCIYYYQTNISSQVPDLFICQDIMHDHSKHSAHGLLFVVTQYSIILGILIVLQSVYSLRKRRLAQILHQHLVSKAQRLRSTLSSVSLVRQSFTFLDSTTTVTTTTTGTLEQKNTKINGHVNQEKNILKKRIISSPAIVLTDPTVPLNKPVTNSDENEPFIKLSNGKNHVHFLLGLDEESDIEEDDDDNNESSNDSITTRVNPPLLSVHSEPYGDRSDALLSMAHILDTNRPWLRQSHDTIP